MRRYHDFYLIFIISSRSSFGFPVSYSRQICTTAISCSCVLHIAFYCFLIEKLTKIWSNVSKWKQYSFVFHDSKLNHFYTFLLCYSNCTHTPSLLQLPLYRYVVIWWKPQLLYFMPYKLNLFFQSLQSHSRTPYLSYQFFAAIFHRFKYIGQLDISFRLKVLATPNISCGSIISIEEILKLPNTLSLNYDFQTF